LLHQILKYCENTNNDVIFESTNETLCEQFVTAIHEECEMSMMGEVNYFLGLKIRKFKHGTFLSQAK